MFAELVFLYALKTNEPLYIGDAGAPYRETGVRVEIYQPLPRGFYLELKPYIWGGEDLADFGGVILRFGVWTKDTFSIALVHQSEHNFDRAPGSGYDHEYKSTDTIEVRWRLK